MTVHQRFHMDTLEQFKNAMAENGVKLPLSEDWTVLSSPLPIGGKTIPNRLAIQPMEGCDGEEDGSPNELAFRRYERFAKGGAGLIWLEANAVTQNGRANPRQFYLTPRTQDGFRELLSRIRCSRSPEDQPYTVLQLTHSGRYSRPEGQAAPMIAARNPYLDGPDMSDDCVISDSELEALEDKYVEAAVLARKVGFDAVDVKASHRYLISGLLSAFTRKGKYGGSFENRTRFLLDIVEKIRDRLGDSMEIAVRLNACDGIPYPYGWGVDREDYQVPDLSEPKKLVRMLWERGVRILNVTCGNPYYNPHINRPYDLGFYTPPEHPLVSAERLLRCGREIQKAVPQMIVMGTGLSWLREYGAMVAAGAIGKGWFQLAGFGRQAIAYPDFPLDIFREGGMKRSKCCISCSKCSEIMRFGGKTGCVVRDSGVYAPQYRKCRDGKPTLIDNRLAEHV